ncbi:MAG: biotin synthase BioB, partial [Deltaproteobacteria bacterium]|nr:biotin synthase BioB [Deltaproteobacteria bacterium]
VVLKAARRARDQGVVRFSVVTSGRSASEADLDRLCAIIEGISGLGLAPCASLGCLAGPGLRRLKSAGLARFHHNLETARSFFPRICTSHPYELRLETLEAARQAGLSLCSGGIFGLGESPAQRLELIQALAGLEVDSVAVNFLNPIPGTPLAGRPLLDAWQGLSIISVVRLVLPWAEIRTCGGRVQTLGPLAPLQYLAGANATMTGDYLTTSGARPEKDLAEIESLGLSLATVF